MTHNKHAQAIQGTQITVESVFLTRFTMNNIAGNCKNAGHRKLPLQSCKKC